MKTVAEQRAAIVAEALTWLHTPYHHHGRIKCVGVDCAQILMAVYCDALQLAPPLDIGFYSTQWHLHRGEELYLDWLDRAGAVPVQAPALGDIAMFRIGRTYSHSAIWLGDQFLHAWHDAGVILTRPGEEPLAEREPAFWSLFE